MDKLIEKEKVLRAIVSLHPKYQHAIMKVADKQLLQSICETVYNIIKGNVKLQSNDVHNLQKFKKILRRLIDKSPAKVKRKILIQKGGFLQVLLPAIISGLSSIIGSYISSKPVEE